MPKKHIRTRRAGYKWGNMLIVLIAAGALTTGLIWGVYAIFSGAGSGGDDLDAEQPALQSPPAVDTSEIYTPPVAPHPEPQPTAEDHRNDWRLILVSPSNPVGYEFTPPELEEVMGFRVDSRIAGSLRQMIAEAADNDGIELMVISGYRPAQRQAELHNAQIQRFIGYGQNREEAVATASTIVLPPGTSEHQTGLAVDIVSPAHQTLNDAFADTDAGRWLQQNSWRYGFILRYPRDSMGITGVIFEPWHFRYVGVEHARAIFEGGYIFEDYLRDVLGVW